MMDPFTNGQNTGGELYFNLGDISEDILRDSRKSFENGLPASEIVENVDTTIWGRVPTLQALVDNFSNEGGARQYQDVGFDGLRNADEQTFYNQEYLSKLEQLYGANSQAYLQAMADPSNDNYHYFRGTDFDNDPLYSSVLQRYKQYNGTEGNSPTNDQNPEGYVTSATSLPDIEDINRDNTLSETERYFQYRVDLNPNTMMVGQNFITDVYDAKGIRLPNGQVGEVKWYQFKIPIKSPDNVFGNISDFKSIRFMRMFLRDFQEPVTLRFVKGTRGYVKKMKSKPCFLVDF